MHGVKMKKQDNLNSQFFSDLKTLSESSFPKKCSSCGAVYESSDQFVQETADIPGLSGLKSGQDDNGVEIVELFRNCVCGSTLMEFYNDRRDTTRAGLRRRELFSKLIDILVNKGLPSDHARSELLKIIHGERSLVLEKMGMKYRAS